MNIDAVHNNREILLLQAISGSRAYGLHTPLSDTDIKGVFALPKHQFYGLHYVEQVNNASNDIVYYELGRFIDLLAKNNPNIVELLSTPPDCILYRHPAIERIKPEIFLSKLCKETFAGYARTQIKKAQGLNKKIFNAVAKERKLIPEFCYIINGSATIPLATWLAQNQYRQEDCGLVSIPHAKDLYAIFHKDQLGAVIPNGIYSGDMANEVKLSAIPIDATPLATLYFAKDSYSSYCKTYREYWEWVEKRNDARYLSTLEHGKNYDAKNMMHTFRLLNMAAEIATEQRINVRRPDRAFLLKIRSGHYLYEELIEMADHKIATIQEAYEKSDLPDAPDVYLAEQTLIELREQLYR